MNPLSRSSYTRRAENRLTERRDFWNHLGPVDKQLPEGKGDRRKAPSDLVPIRIRSMSISILMPHGLSRRSLAMDRLQDSPRAHKTVKLSKYARTKTCFFFFHCTPTPEAKYSDTRWHRDTCEHAVLEYNSECRPESVTLRNLPRYYTAMARYDFRFMRSLELCGVSSRFVRQLLFYCCLIV